MVGSISDGSSKRLLQDQTNALYVPAAGEGVGHVLFRREDALMAQSFDVGSLAFVGEMVPLVEHVPISVNTGFGAFSVSNNGTLVYRPGDIASTRELVWTDRAGKRLGAATKPGPFNVAMSLSPDQ